MRFILPVLGLTLIGGCHVCAPAGDYTWTIQAPAAVAHAPHSKVRFTVETKTLDGQPAAGVPYIWVIDWVGIRGVQHNGESFREESILVKGGPGTAQLYALACAPNGHLVEVARVRLEVNWPQP